MTERYRQKTLFSYDWQIHDALKNFTPLAIQPYSLFFDSARDGHPLNRYSYICWQPFETIESKDGRVTITNKDQNFSYMADPFQVVQERLALWGDGFKPRENAPPFQGGAAGYFGYDLARGLEKIPSKSSLNKTQPDMCIGLYDKVLAFDHHRKKAFLMIWADDKKTATAQKDYLEKMISFHRGATNYKGADLDWKTSLDDSGFKRTIEKVIEYIHAGDIFQANLSRRFTAKLPEGFDPFSHYAHLRTVNAAPYSAYMNFGEIKLASSSPERFLAVKNRQVETRPIKGTMPSTSPAHMLENSEKDRSENTMIVDLLRNDLSRVCEDHSVGIEKLCAIETFEGLHHMVSTIKGILRADRTAMDALRACFPGGSITGAPKIRAMEIIEELEPQRRGAYCGAIGLCGFDGRLETAITIRTLVYEKNNVQLQTGGGIVAESDPEAELAETLVKARAIFESFAGPVPEKDYLRSVA